MILIKTKLVERLGASAVTIFPFVFAAPWIAESTLLHEAVHFEQQRRWAIYGFGIGLLVWWALYCLALPVKWNPWRRKWETAAYKAQGVDESEIEEILRRAPYYLA